MKYVKLFVLTLTISLFVMAFSAISYGGEEMSDQLKKGEALFDKYGCVKCHANGKDLDKLPAKEELKQEGALEKVINQCLQGPSKTKALEPASEEMQQLKAFVMHIATHATQKGSETMHQGSEHKHEGAEPQK